MGLDFQAFVVHFDFLHVTLTTCSCILSSICSSREVEEELEVVWQAATRENQQMRETLLDSKLTADLHGWADSCNASQGWPSRAQDEAATSTRHQPHSSMALLFTSHQSPELQRKAIFKSDSYNQNISVDEKHKHGLDFYC